MNENNLQENSSVDNSEEKKDVLKNIEIEKNYKGKHIIPNKSTEKKFLGIYDYSDFEILLNFKNDSDKNTIALKTLDELLEKDKQRETDGFPRRIRIGKYVKPSKNNNEQFVTTEPKFYHDNAISEDNEGEPTGGSGDGDEGDVIAEQPAEPQEGEGKGQGAGQGDGSGHDVSSDAFDLGKVLTEKFELPNLKTKGKKVSLTKFQYDLTDKNRGFGQLLDKKATIRKIIETNILLGNINPDEEINVENLVINPNDQIFRILSKEKDYESEAVVFFIRDYSGSMQGKPTEVIVTQHLFIYSWLMFQYQNNVKVRFILHDTEAKEVPDFYTYYRSMVAGGTNVSPSYELVNKIIEEEQLAKDYNIYVFHGTDGDDWEETGENAVKELKRMIATTNRIGITVAKNSWSSADKETTVEKYISKSGIIKDNPLNIRIDSMSADNATEARIIEGIKNLVS